MNGEGRPPRRMDGDGAMGDGPRGPGSKDGAMRDGPRGPGSNDGAMRNGPMSDGAMNGEGRPPRRMDGDGAMGDGARGPGSKDGAQAKGPKPSVPMGPPSKMTLIVEPPITFDAAWFTPEKQLSINGK